MVDVYSTIYRKINTIITIIKFCRISELNANSVDPDKTPHSAASENAASDQGLHCLSMPLNA